MLQLKRLLMEVVDVNKVYSSIYSAVIGSGTEPNAIVNAIRPLSAAQCFELFKLFKDGKTGYKSFTSMVNSEYDRTNAAEIKQLIYVLNLKGIRFTADFGTNNFGNTFFNGNFKFVSVNKNVGSCRIEPDVKRGYELALPKAIQFWKNWLSNPITKDKINKNWKQVSAGGFDNVSGIEQIKQYFLGTPIENAYKEWFELLNIIRLEFYHCGMTYSKSGRDAEENALAFVVNDSNKGLITCNGSLKNNDYLGTLIHEIQHMLYYIKPINPIKFISNSMVTKTKPAESAGSIQSSLVAKPTNTNTNNAISYSNNIKTTSAKYNISPDKLNIWLERAKRKEKKSPGYVSDWNEKMSNIMSIRKFFNIKPGENITINHIIPYINEVKSHTDVYWFLCGWAINGFKDLQSTLDSVNALAVNDTKNNTPNEIPNEPGTT